jgi:two-component system sensor histidine kinase KdpD
VHVEVNAVDDLLGALTQRMESTPAGARLRLTLSPAEPLLLGRFDLVHSLRILANLVENAAKYAPPDTPIDVTAARDGTEIVVMVSDRGPGIAAADVERIFDPFYRPARPAPDVGGTGLGLSIARRLAELQGGRVTYAPRSGAGSTFSLHLPAEDIEIAARSL